MLEQEIIISNKLGLHARASAKLVQLVQVQSNRAQYGQSAIYLMPTNLYGPGDNYHPENSHVIPALLRKFHEAKVNRAAEVVVWGTGTPRREFMYSEDMADACVYLMQLPDDKYTTLLGSDEAKTGRFEPPLINIGVGSDVTILELATTIRHVVGYEGSLVFDTDKPDGTMRKLQCIDRLASMGWSPQTSLEVGLRKAYLAFAGKAENA